MKKIKDILGLSIVISFFNFHFQVKKSGSNVKSKTTVSKEETESTKQGTYVEVLSKPNPNSYPKLLGLR